MIGLVWVLVGCEYGGRGEARGVLDFGEGTQRVDGGALAMDTERGRALMLSTRGWNFDCDWARFQLNGGGGKNIKRRGDYRDLTWYEDTPGIVMIAETEGDLGGSASGSCCTELDVELEFDDDTLLAGTLRPESGDVRFFAEDCGTL